MAKEVVPCLVGGFTTEELVDFWADIDVEFRFDEEELVLRRCYACSAESGFDASDPRVDVLLVEGRKFHFLDTA